MIYLKNQLNIECNDENVRGKDHIKIEVHVLKHPQDSFENSMNN